MENLNRKYSKTRAQSLQVVTVNQTVKSNEERETEHGHEDAREKNRTESRRRRTSMVTRTRRWGDELNTINQISNKQQA